MPPSRAVALSATLIATTTPNVVPVAALTATPTHVLLAPTPVPTPGPEPTPGCADADAEQPRADGDGGCPSTDAPAPETPDAEVLVPWSDPGPLALPDDLKLMTAEPMSAQGLSWPLRGPITSLFGPAHPLGIDIAAVTGAPVGAAADGRVAVAGFAEGYGFFTLINHTGGYATLYAHFVAPPVVAVGDAVRRGQTLGFAGSTGHSTGPHLHFEVHRNGLLIDPLTVLPNINLSIVAQPDPCPTAAARVTRAIRSSAVLSAVTTRTVGKPW